MVEPKSVLSSFFYISPTTHLPYYLPGPSPDQTKIKLIIQTSDQTSFCFKKEVIMLSSPLWRLCGVPRTLLGWQAVFPCKQLNSAGFSRHTAAANHAVTIPLFSQRLYLNDSLFSICGYVLRLPREIWEPANGKCIWCGMLPPIPSALPTLTLAWGSWATLLWLKVGLKTH